MSKMNGIAKGLTLVSLTLLGCQTRDAGRFDPKLIQQTHRNSAAENERVGLRELPTKLEPRVPSNRRPVTRAASRPATAPAAPAGTTPTTEPTTAPSTGDPTTQPTPEPVTEATPATATAPAVPTTAGYDPTVSKPTVRMTLEEVVHRTVVNNKDAAVAAYEPAIDQTRVIEAEARFDPEFFTNFNSGESRIFNQGLGNVDTPTRTNQLQSGLRSLLTSGGQIELRAGTSIVDRNDPEGINGLVKPFTNPYYLHEITLQVTQPLLRDLGYATNQARIVIARNTQHVSLLEFRRQLEESVENAERAYWQLVQAQRELEIAQRLLDRTEETYDTLVRRQRVDVTEVQISQAASTAALRRATLVRARSQVEQVSNQLKRIMGDPDFPVAGDVVVLAITPPLETPVIFDVQDQIGTALDYRLELGQQQLRIDSATTAHQVARQNLKPQLNLQGTVGVNGVGYDFNDALNSFDEDDLDTWTLGLQFEFPLGNRAARAIWRRAQLQRQQAILSYQALIEQVTFEVKNAVLEVETTWNELYESRNARMEASRALQAIQAREEGGERLDPTFVQLKLDRQASLAEAESREAASLAGYNAAIARLEKTKGTLLRYNNVIMAEDLPYHTINALEKRY